MISQKAFTTSSLIQLNHEAAAIHTIALLMKEVDDKTFSGSLADQAIIEDQIEEKLLDYNSMGLDCSRIIEESHKINKIFFKIERTLDSFCPIC